MSATGPRISILAAATDVAQAARQRLITLYGDCISGKRSGKAITVRMLA